MLRATFARGDLEGCQTIIDELAAEAEMARIISDEANAVILELEEDMDTFPEIRESARARIKELSQTVTDGEITIARHAFAVIRLRQMKEAR